MPAPVWPPWQVPALQWWQHELVPLHQAAGLPPGELRLGWKRMELLEQSDEATAGGSLESARRRCGL